MAIRMSPSTQSSNLSPYHLVFGKEMNLPFDTALVPREGLNKDAKAHVSDLMAHLKIVKDIAKENIKKAQEKQKQQYDKKTKEAPSFRVGQSVLLHSTKVPIGLSPKLSNPWDGPFYITAIGPNNTYKLRKCSSHKELKSYIHANRLKPYDTLVTGQVSILLHEMSRETTNMYLHRNDQSKWNQTTFVNNNKPCHSHRYNRLHFKLCPHLKMNNNLQPMRTMPIQTTPMSNTM